VAPVAEANLAVTLTWRSPTFQMAEISLRAGERNG